MDSLPHIKYEQSPAESLADSFVSTPGSAYPPLFDTMNPEDAMTPQSFDDDSHFGGSMNGDMAGTPAPEKKPVKKRKSWGQQLPEPKTNLPPRKRAKTEDEKEQRRVERVLRNRRAAQSSRERKRQEVEALQEEKDAVERTNRDLMAQLQHMAAKNAMLQQELERIGGSSMTVFGSSSVASTPCEDVRQAPSPITFSKQLFPSGNQDNRSISTQSLVDTTVPATVNPASLSPEIRPVADASNASSSDMTQHPAVSVGRTTALDGFDINNFNHLSNFGDESLHQHDFGSYFDAPDASESNHQLFQDGVLPITDAFCYNLDNMDGHNDSEPDNFDLGDFLHDDQPATEIQSSDQLAETTASLQPQFGASSFGCDDGGNAVSV